MPADLAPWTVLTASLMLGGLLTALLIAAGMQRTWRWWQRRRQINRERAQWRAVERMLRGWDS